MIRPLTKREADILALCILVVFIFFGYHSAVKPIRNKIYHTDKRIVAAKTKLNKSNRILRKDTKYKNQYIKYLSKFSQKSSNEEVVSSILSEIEEAAGKLDLRISDLKPKRVNEDKYFSRFSVSLRIDSSFVNIMNFLHTLQSKPHLFKVEELRFDKGSRRKSDIVKTHLVLSRILIPTNK